MYADGEFNKWIKKLNYTRPKNVTLKKYWEFNTAMERIEIIENAFAYIEKLEEYKRLNLI